jgi:hypothetical protein
MTRMVRSTCKSVTISADVLDRIRQAGASESAIEDANEMAAREEPLDDGSAEKSRSAKDEDSHVRIIRLINGLFDVDTRFRYSC